MSAASKRKVEARNERESVSPSSLVTLLPHLALSRTKAICPRSLLLPFPSLLPKLYFISSIVSTARGHHPHVVLLIFHSHGSRITNTWAKSVQTPATIPRTRTSRVEIPFPRLPLGPCTLPLFCSVVPLFRPSLLNRGSDNTPYRPLRATRCSPNKPAFSPSNNPHFYPNILHTLYTPVPKFPSPLPIAFHSIDTYFTLDVK